ncbi:MAG TPA: tyrosine/phenylalanine carboxypeptidase domain-containing protein [Longimicrobiales bacterium]|nr:tyrosine/phenylalanine carboxypeptidase domain-containing protein [Longimicrobiales bacterium]
MEESESSGSDSWHSIDRTLADIESSFDFLTLISCEDLDTAWEEFRSAAFERAPALRPPSLDVDVDGLRRRVASLPIHRIEDVDLQFLLASKQAGLDWQLHMLQQRGTRTFLTQSMLHYHPVSDGLLKVARESIEDLPDSNGGDDEMVDADGIRERAERELEIYRKQDPDFSPEIRQEEDQASLQASDGDLLVPDDMELPPTRLEALTQHEVGAHVVTYHNGMSQPLQILRNGLSDYDEMQEAIGVLAEFFADGFTPMRLRTLAARVIGVHSLEEGASFVETFRTLTNDVGLGEYNAFAVTARIHVCSGFTRDQIYLRGLIDLLGYLRADGELEPLYIGKIGFQHIPSLTRLRQRGFLSEPPLRPAFLQNENARSKLKALRKGLSPRDLVTG